MAPIRIVTDSASDIPQGFYQGVSVIPLAITFGDKTFLDGVTLTHQQFYERLIESDELPTTSMVSPGQFAEVFEDAVNAGEDVVAVVLSSKLSGTYESALLAAQQFPGRVHVVDSMNATLGERILVEYAARLRDQGLDAAAVAQGVQDVRGRVRTMGVLDMLEYLRKGGRISGATAAVGGMLSIKPVMWVTEGEIKQLGKARGSKNGNNYLMRMCQENGVDFSMPHCTGYTGLDDTLLAKYVSDSAPLWKPYVDELPTSTIGATIGTHVGPGAIAVAFFARER